MQRVNSLLSAGVTLTSTGTAVASPIPFDSSGYFPKFVRVVASGAGCYVKVGDIGVTAVAGDCMIQPLDGTVLNVSGCKAISAISVTGTSSITVVPLERGSWNYDQRTLDYDFTTLSAVPSPVTFTRGSSGTFFGSDGLLKVQGYNLLLQSVDLTNAAWGKSNCTVTGSDPSFLATTSSVTHNVTNGSGGVSGVTVTPSTSYVFTFYAKRGTMTDVKYSVYNITGAANIIAPTSYYSQINSDTETRITVSFTTPVGCTSINCFLLRDSGVTGTVYLGKPQLETGSTATQYSPTTTAANSAPRLDYDPATPAGVTGGELMVNGTFASGDVGWLHSNGNGSTVISTGFANITTPDSVFASIQPTPNPLTVGKTYLCSITILSSTGGGIALVAGSAAQSVTFSNPGTYSVYLRADGAQLQVKRAGTATNTTFTNISVREVTFAPRGLLVEEQRANLLLQSADFGTTWSLATGLKAFGSGSTLNATTAPDGTVSADLITEDATTGLHRVIQGGLTTTAQAYTLSCFVKPNGRQIVGLRLSDGVTTFGVGLNTSTLASVAITGDTAPTTQSIVSVGGGWYRVSMTATTAAAAGTAIATVCGVSGAAISYTGDNTSGYYLWGAQLEQGSFPTSYIPTTTASATRSADSVSMTGTNFSSWYNQTQGTFVVEADVFYSATYNGRFFDVDCGATSVRLRGSGAAYGLLVDDGSTLGINSTKSLTVNTPAKIAFAYASNDCALSVNAETPVADTTVTINTASAFKIGAGYATANREINGHIRRLSFYPTRLPNATLQALST